MTFSKRKPSVIERYGHSVNDSGQIIYDDRPVSLEKAESLYGSKLDRRRNYCIINGEVCITVSWSSACSGCSVGMENVICERGGGCYECGYTGRRCHSVWMPYRELIKDLDD